MDIYFLYFSYKWFATYSHKVGPNKSEGLEFFLKKISEGGRLLGAQEQLLIIWLLVKKTECIGITKIERYKPV